MLFVIISYPSLQVISLSISPDLMKTATSFFTNDAIQRATEILAHVGGQSMGELNLK